MRRAPRLALLAAALAAGCAAPAGRPKALVIGIDGLLPEDLARAPALSALLRRGTRADGAGAAGFAELLSGAGGTTIFERLKAARPTAETACFAGAGALDLAPGAPARAALDCLLVPPESASAAERDRAAVEAAYEALAGAGRFAGADVDLVCVHLAARGAAPEALPPAGGRPGPAMSAALSAADEHVARLLAPLPGRPGRAEEDWLVVVAATATQDGGAAPLLLAADGALPGRLDLAGASAADVAPTVLAWLGVEAPAGEPSGRARLP